MEKNRVGNVSTVKVIISLLFLAVFVVMMVSFVSFWMTWKFDYSSQQSFFDRTESVENALGKVGATLSYFFVYKGFGITSFLFPFYFLFIGLAVFFRKFKPLLTFFKASLFFLIVLPLVFALVLPGHTIFSGVVGFELYDFLKDYLGKIGVGLLLFIAFLLYGIVNFNLDFDKYLSNKKQDQEDQDQFKEEDFEIENEQDTEEDFYKQKEELLLKGESISLEDKQSQENQPEIKKPNPLVVGQEVLPTHPQESQPELESTQDNLQLQVEELEQEIELENIQVKAENFGQYDPTLDLSHYRFPEISLLKDYTAGKSLKVDEEELQKNKDKIVDTLQNYGIGIKQIKATIGPTVTLYEIVPSDGVRVSKIKNLEDDIALSLAALGIRIIAPIPGKGTIGIEVPSSSPSIVSMRSVIASEKFQETDMELPIAFGKTISNETFVADLAKMPHMLMAGATGQGKSVGLNAIIASLLYKKHPAELKFVFVDPKKVELTLYNKIERHYLAKLPDSEEPIITDTNKVIHTLNSLCIEMDNRYDLLKNAMVRNLKEYNVKFKDRKLNPNDGHKFLPYIVLVIDEFADLIMTAGKEVETPIARLAQLARAVGIHLIVATQRPSVNVITGIIKANFPARVAFRVTSKIDSRTILDASGADQLIGKGDMLYTTGNEMTRIQCAFVDTPEVDKITEFIGNQQGYADAFLLPEYEGESSEGSDLMDLDDKDTLFEEAARLIVTAQQGSASLLQRKLKIGYNRAGRLIDQMEAAGIVGPFEGSKARQVLVKDLIGLEQLLS